MMVRMPRAARAAPLVAGLAGLGWFWAAQASVRAGYPDTDDPSVGLAFVLAHPEAWYVEAAFLFVLAVGLIATVLSTQDRMAASEATPAPIAMRTVTAIGVIAAAMFLGTAIIRMSAGPLAYVGGLNRQWGETAYLVTQFVGPQLLEIGGVTMLAAWIAGTAWTGGRRRVVPKPLALLAILPAYRLAGLPGLVDLLPGAWILWVLAIPTAFLWLLLLGASDGEPATGSLAVPASAI
jgi:hypothetical protein